MADTVYIPAGTHSVLGPSGAERWFACPASVQLSEAFGDRGKTINEEGELVSESSRYAREGTAAHHVFADALMNNKDVFMMYGTEIVVEDETFVVDREMVMEVGRAVEAARAMIDVHTIMYVEESVKFNSDARATGSCDLGLFNVKTRHLRVVDFKYGAGETVEAQDNKQMMCYTAGLRQTVEGVNPKKPKIDTFDTCIIQPRGQGAMVKVSAPMNRDTFVRWEKEDLARAVRRTKAKKPKFLAGEHCHYCSHQTNCNAMAKFVAPAVSGHIVDPDLLSDDKLIEIYAKSKVIRTFLWKVEEALEFKLRAGQLTEGDGVKLKRGKAPNRKWKDEDGLERAAITEFGEDACYDRKFRSPAQIEKLPKGKAFVEENSVRGQGGLKLTLSSDKAEGITPPGADVFKKLSTSPLGTDLAKVLTGPNQLKV